MEIKLKELWEEANIDESMEEYVKRIVSEKIGPYIDLIINTKISALASEVAITKGFAECADSKINAHLMGHNKIKTEKEND